MKRYVQILGLVVLALAASGWGSVVAAVLCPHANSMAFKTSAVESTHADQACHSVKPEPVTKPHCHDSNTGQDATAAAGAETPTAMPVANGYSNAFELPQNVPCTHCLSRPEVPSSNVIPRLKADQKRGFEPVALQASMHAMPAPSFIKPVLYRQGAPPGPSKPKHLLIGILLI